MTLNDEPIPMSSEDLTQQTYATLDQIRRKNPVCPVVMPPGTPSYLVTGYDEARVLLNDPRVSKDSTGAFQLLCVKGGPKTSASHTGQLLASHMLHSDPPVHTRLRKLINKAFTSRTVARLRPRVEEIATDLLDGMEGLGRADLLSKFAGPMPITVICELLGVHDADRNDFTGWSNTLLSAASQEAIDPAAQNMRSYLAALVRQKRAEPGPDLMSDLVRASDESNSLTEDELVAMAFLLLVAGHETTVNLIANATLALLRAPEQLAKLKADLGLLPGAIEEFLRFDGPINIATMRFTTEPIDVGGMTIPAGEFVEVSLLAANRDPKRFVDPDKLDITRATNGHVAFGHGIHHCVGAPLARLEAEIALRSLIGRFPDLRLAAEPEQLRYRDSALVHGLQELPVLLH